MIRQLATLAIIPMAFVGWACSSPPADHGDLFKSAPAAPLTEDDPGWDCWTMGDGWCGPVTITFDSDGATASVWDNPPDEAIDNFVASGLPVTVVPTINTAACGVVRPSEVGTARSGPVSGVYVTDRANPVHMVAVVHTAPSGPCVGALVKMDDSEVPFT